MSFDTHNIEIDPTYCSTHPELHPGRYVLMAVTDTGCGMTPEIQGPYSSMPFFTTKGVGQGNPVQYSRNAGCYAVLQDAKRSYSIKGLQERLMDACQAQPVVNN